mmetsp:Transcript_70193/g.137868  ORF Transcript_70193/g.137868 Transcript_70193/m.137868 type:complete len:128 (+) Transcript_70193:502-885(+)
MQASSRKVQERVREGLEVVSPALLDAHVCVDARVPSGAGQWRSLRIHIVHQSLLVPVALGKPEINDVHDTGLVAEAHDEVVGLDVSVDQAPGVAPLQPVEHLIPEHQHGLHGESPADAAEDVLDGGT